MKKIWVYLLGILTGVILTIIISFLISKTLNLSSNSGYSFFEEAGDVINARSFTVFQAGEGSALAQEFPWDDLIVLLYNEKGIPYYDGQVVTPKRGECFRQIGIFKYKSNDGLDRTVPIVTIMDGEIEDPEIVERMDKNYVFFDTPGEVMSDKSYKISRILNDSSVIANGKGDWRYNDDFYPGLEVLIFDHNASTYYNEQIIKAPNGKCFRQIGIYKTDGVFEEVIPIVKLMDR